jgi:hypothetical protein
VIFQPVLLFITFPANHTHVSHDANGSFKSKCTARSVCAHRESLAVANDVAFYDKIQIVTVFGKGGRRETEVLAQHRKGMGCLMIFSFARCAERD